MILTIVLDLMTLACLSARKSVNTSHTSTKNCNTPYPNHVVANLEVITFAACAVSPIDISAVAITQSTKKLSNDGFSLNPRVDIIIFFTL